MSESYKYKYTQFSIFGSLPTYKVYLATGGGKAKFIFADNTFIYGNISDWALKHSGLDTRKSLWAEEPKLFLENEKGRLQKYRDLHPAFVTKPNNSHI
ncbi:hypothetical protein [Acinetobacter chengduensis]|uniref:Uncharacterized protein n=1 Tax=Acinetobacter chengduensis TaxID=2420890 RepID=A0ABX9TR77_9GAMM|nr:hypothetical protein [Acinetobacter chengduensis]RLL17256.1 hypothetical protein D9K81_17275 [Acinetobacter chengduensis]